MIVGAIGVVFLFIALGANNGAITSVGVILIIASKTIYCDL